jgi:hypothetical protein
MNHSCAGFDAFAAEGSCHGFDVIVSVDYDVDCDGSID